VFALQHQVAHSARSSCGLTGCAGWGPTGGAVDDQASRVEGVLPTTVTIVFVGPPGSRVSFAHRSARWCRSASAITLNGVTRDLMTQQPRFGLSAHHPLSPRLWHAPAAPIATGAIRPGPPAAGEDKAASGSCGGRGRPARLEGPRDHQPAEAISHGGNTGGGRGRRG